MNKSLKRSRFVTLLLVLTVCVQMGPFMSVSYASHTGVGDMHGGTPIGPGSAASAPGDPEPGELPPNNTSSDEDNTEPVIVSTGEFVMTEKDMTVPSRGMPLEFIRTYRSQRAFNGPLGYGWYFNFYTRLQKLSSNNILIIDGESGRKNEFVYNASTPDTFNSPLGVYEQLVHNGNGTHALTKSNGTKYNFDLEGKLTSIVDRNNNTISLSYDPAGKLPLIGSSKYFVNLTSGVIAFDYRISTITDTVGRPYQFNYNADGRISTIVDYAGRTWTYTYENDNLKTVKSPASPQYPAGLTTVYTYDIDHNLKTITDPKGQTYLTNHYDAQDRVSSQDFGSGTASFVYDPSNNKTTVTDFEGHVTEWTFNATGNPTQRKDFTEGIRPGDPASYITIFTYNTNMEVTQITRPKLNGTKFVYDTGNANPRARGNLLQIRHKTSMAAADSSTNDLITNFTYESQFNQVKTMTDPKGNITTYTYDYELPTNDPKYGTKGNLVKIQQPQVNSQIPTTHFTYNSFGQITELQDPNGIITQYTYFPATGYLQQIKQDPSGINAITQMTYDTFGNLDTVTDANIHTTDYNYNELNWLIEEINPLTYKTKYFYDQNANLQRTERQANMGATQWQVTQFTYNIFDLLATVTDPLNRVATYGYDNNRNRTSILDHEGNTTTFEYDERDLLFKVKDANSPQGTTQYDYDANGNLVRLTDANLVQTNYTNDLFDRQQRITYADTRFSEFVYDKNNNITRHTTPSTALIEFDYDTLNRRTMKRFPATSSLDSTYIYDLGSRLTDANNAASQIHFVYDNLNRVDTETQTLNGVVYTLNPAFDKVGNRTQLVYPSTKNVEYVYNVNDRLEDVKVNTSVLAHHVYDTLDRRTQRDYMTPAIQRATYQYDLANQLDLMSNFIVGGANISSSDYTYDGVGNRKTLTTFTKSMTYNYNDIYELESVTGGQINSYDYDKVHNRLTVDGDSYTPNNLNQYSNVDGVTYSYDNNGNLTNDGTNIYTFDAQNRLATLNAPGTVNDATYAYDALDRRVSKTVNGVITRFIYDGIHAIEERSSGGALQADYVYGAGIDEVLTMSRGGSTYYYHSDGLSSITQITNSSGGVVDSYEYDAYGQTINTSSISNPYMFTGARFDTESGLHYMRARMFDGSIGRFIQRDPLGYTDNYNLYSYVTNNPVNFIDPFGLEIYNFTIVTIIRKPDFQAGVKSTQTITVDTDKNTISSSAGTGTTNVGVNVPARVKDFNVSAMSGNNGLYRFNADGTTGSWFYPANIDYHFSFIINENNKKVSVSGRHDSYPSYMVIQEGKILYDFQQNKITNLFGDADDESLYPTSLYSTSKECK